MKLLLIAFLFCLPGFAICQSDSLSEDGETLYLVSGYKISKGDAVKFGVGSTQSGAFKYIRKNSSSLFSYTSKTDNAADNANNMPRNMAGMSLPVKRIEKRGSKKMGFAYYLVVKQSIIAYECDVKNAIASGELEVPPEFIAKSATAAPAKLSVADEIMKFKKMMDDGIITKEEFEAKKKKLLEE